MIYNLPDITGTGVVVALGLASQGIAARFVQVNAGLANTGVDATGAVCCRVGGLGTSSSQGTQIAPGGGQFYPADPADSSPKYSLDAMLAYVPTGDTIQVCYGD